MASAPDAGLARAHPGAATAAVLHPPAPRAMSAAAAIVWLADRKARGGFRSVLVEPGPDGSARVVAERAEAIMASAGDLWVVRTKKVHSLGCVECDKCTTDPPTCQRNESHDQDELYLESLRTGRVLEPWRESFVPSKGCADLTAWSDSSVELTGAVGTVIFATISSMTASCGAAHPNHGDHAVAFDLDAEKIVTLSFPADEVSTALAQAAAIELARGDGPCAAGDAAPPAQGSATAEYGPDGVLHGVYLFTTSKSYACGTQGSMQTSAWLPPQVAAFGKLPAFVASYLAASKATFAMPIATERVEAVEKELAKR